MTSEGATSKIQVEIDHLLLYRKSRVGILTGKLVEPLYSKGKVFVKAGEDCKVKFKFDIVDLAKLRDVKDLEIVIKNSCEEKMYKSSFVKQFTADSFCHYISDKPRTETF